MILAVDSDGGIGKNGCLPWHIPGELKYFKSYTKGHTCVMGRTTYEDIKAFKKTSDGPLLPNRSCIVFTRDIRTIEDSNTYANVFFNDNPKYVLDMLTLAKRSYGVNALNFCIIGGKSIYEMFSKSDVVDEISVTFVSGSYDCDTFIDVDALTKNHEIVSTNPGSDLWNVRVYRRKNEKRKIF